jgi:glutamyl-tRNA synthetase
VDTPVSQKKKRWLLKIIDLLKNRAMLLTDFIDLGVYFFEKPMVFDPAGIKKYLQDKNTWNLMQKCRDFLEKADTFDEAEIENIIRNLAADQQVSAGKVIHPLRLALTGRTASPGLFEIAALLGKIEVMERIDYLLSKQNKILKDS